MSVVTPVYQGELTLEGLAVAIEALTAPQITPDGHSWDVMEWLLVYDNGPDASADVMAELAEKYGEQDFEEMFFKLLHNSDRDRKAAVAEALQSLAMGDRRT